MGKDVINKTTMNRVYNTTLKQKHRGVLNKVLYAVKENLNVDNGVYKESFIKWELRLTPNEYRWLGEIIKELKRG